MARTGKIARLPLAVREELNTRLRDNESGQTILAWVNELQVTKEVLARHFGGVPISDANLSEWRSGGFAEWLDEQEKVHRIEKLSELSARLAKASGGNISEGMMAIAVGKLQEALEDGQDVEVGDDGEAVVVGAALDKVVIALMEVRNMELAAQKLALQKQVVEQRGEKLALDKKKFQRTTCELFIKWAADEQAKKIATSDLATDGKIEALGRHLFGDAW